MNEQNSGIGLLKNEKKYWEEKLAGALERATFPYDWEVGQTSENVKKAWMFRLSTDAFEGLKKLCGDSQYKLHILLVTAIKIMLYKYSGCEDILVGSPIYKQKKEGVFLNTLLPFRDQVCGDMTVKELLLQVRETVLEANENQNYPVMKELSSPILDVMIIVDHIHDRKYVEHVPRNMTFGFLADGEGISIEIEYNASLYRQFTIQRIAQGVDHILHVLPQNMDQKIMDTHILTKEQQEEIVTAYHKQPEWNIEETLLHQLFQEQVGITPDQVAVISGDDSLTYHELNVKANQLARLLRAKGVQTRDVVGIMVDPSVELAIGLFAIIKAGGTYVPLDPRYPEDRLEFMMQDSSMRFVVTEEKYADRFADHIELADVHSRENDLLDTSNLNIAQSVEDLAYIIYTSGSTGKPKGVMIEHRTISKTMLWRKAEYDFTPEDTILQLVSYSFDGFIGGFFAPLFSGSKVVLLGNEEDKDVNRIRKCIKEKKVTHLHGVPALMSVIMERISDDEAKCLKVITVGGDRATPVLIHACSIKNIELINEYGPTENTIISTIFRNMNDPEHTRIGKPVYDTQIYILDQDDHLCPIGVVGELCISGGRLARGYVNRPDLTAEKFVKNPFYPEQLMYRTGDLAKWDEDGNIDFIGRKDFQVKIRGFRIELGEIESKLLAYPGIKQTVVIDREEANGEKYLCAYFVADEQGMAQEIIRHLSAQLPDYMIPAHIMQLPELPLTANGKIDRKTLPLPLDTSREHIPPGNEKEQKIANVWNKVLSIDNIGIHDNFFKKGGDSLKAIRAASLLSEEFVIAINDIYKHQTIYELAAHIEHSQGDLAAKIEQVKNEIAAAVEESPSINLEEEYDRYKRKIERYRDIKLVKSKKYKKVLLTGATGYVGAHLLKELFDRSDSTFYLLIRGQDLRLAEERLKQKVLFYFGDSYYENMQSRVIILNGEIGEPSFGLEETAYEALAQEIDCIIHSAAFVKHYGEYETFYKSNVQGTKHLLQFAQQGRRKDFNLMSTTTISDGEVAGNNAMIFTEYEMDVGQKSENYYSLTKLESEKLVMAAANNGLEVKIFRLGNVSFHYETGAFQENIEDNAICKSIKSYIKLNTFPFIEAKELNFSYVDQVAKSIVLLFDKADLANETFHIYNPHQVSLAELAELLQEKYPTLEVKSLDEFLATLLQNTQNEELRPYLDHILMYMGSGSQENRTEMIHVNDKTIYLLEHLGFQWSALDKDAIQKMVQYWETVQFLS
ncbi:amino acid adenylation domain-containing protein [Brevibacillus sp. SYSU BS000544]|uniref:non-ribosomal peptide synthetase family protein n=1 Tax=Brevibacillus sp. SYSU BS000544 TaxID=3416443 RepID=UPI003CE5764F